MSDQDTPSTEEDPPATDLLGDPVDGGANAAYKVLARKYRPLNFDELIGQDALVRTLTNAINTGRIAQAFMLTGVRGVGKTTTARIIAKALNCTGPDGALDGPTPSPCGQCDNCKAITEDRHVDVMEMDAASHTGVDNMRDIIDSVLYAPISARFKVYIIDEVHMLSKPAFNALLKTLEEPPAHVKFVFATTEIGKVPVTVLSRCQRFDLRRLDMDLLGSHLSDVAAKEGANIEDAAIALLARAADGSVRDGLSLLDQVIAQADPDTPVVAVEVRKLLGLADRNQILDLYDLVMRGQAPDALTLLDDMYSAGAEPAVIAQDMLDVTHWLTRLKVTPETARTTGVADAEKDRAETMAGELSMPILTRCWQMLLKGYGEVQMAGQPLTALEMLLIRLCYVADLPPPAEIVKALEGGGNAPAAPASSPAAGNGGVTAIAGSGPRTEGAVLRSEGAGPQAVAQRLPEDAPLPEPYAQADIAPSPTVAPQPASFVEAVELFADNREMQLYSQLKGEAHLVAFEPGRIELRPTSAAPPNLANRMGALLTEWTGARWVVSVSAAEGASTLKQQEQAADSARREDAAQNPVVQAVMENFPGAEISAIRDLAAEAEGLAAPEDDNDDDTEGDSPDVMTYAMTDTATDAVTGGMAGDSADRSEHEPNDHAPQAGDEEAPQ